MKQITSSIPHIVSIALLIARPAFCETARAITTETSPAPSSFVVQYERFEWKEFGADGRLLLKESGYRPGLLWESGATENKSPALASRLNIYLGTVDYDGQTQIGEPVESSTDYIGGKGELDLLFPQPWLEHVTISPFLGAGVHTWLRQLDDTGGFTQTGYDEWWFSAYAQTGAQCHWNGNGGTWRVRAGIRYPFYNWVEYDFILPDGSSGISVKPEEDIGLFAEFGFATGGYYFGLFAEEWNYKQSDIKDRGGVGVYQPTSEQQSIGLTFGITY